MSLFVTHFTMKSQQIKTLNISRLAWWKLGKLKVFAQNNIPNVASDGSRSGRATPLNSLARHAIEQLVIAEKANHGFGNLARVISCVNPKAAVDNVWNISSLLL